MKLSRTCKLLLSAGCLLLPSALFVHGQDCFYPNGALAATDDHPCSSDGHSTCCPLNWQCLSNGLCYLENEGYLGRYTCTDSTWESDNCPKICLYGGTAAGNEAIQECSKGSYCCDANRPEIGCCQTSNDFFSLPDGSVVASIGANSPVGHRAAPSSLTSAPPSESGRTTVATAESSAAADFPATSNTGISDSDLSSATLAQTSLSPSATPPSSTAKATLPSTDSPSEKENAEATTSTPVPVSSVILITSVVINSAGVSFTSITTQIVEPQVASSSSPLPSTQGSSASNLGLKIGLGVGIPAGVIVIALLGFFLLRRRNNSRRRLPTSMENPRMNGSNPMEYMYKGHGDADSPLTATTTSPDLNQRASSKYVVSDIGEGGYRGVKSGGHSGLGLQPGSIGHPSSPTRSELSGDPSAPHDYRNSQMSELAAPLHHPSELPDRPYR